ncbi:MAG: DNA-3-methyladenine glycosylase [Bacteroidetes bacterium]|nr:DNA-3-methyladenine glycosylase [Bacteroidota bacterium]
MKLPNDYYLKADVVAVARDLIGKVLFTRIDGQVCAGVISETEAYAGETDKASHAYGGRNTERTRVMYEKGGISYVYLCYGIHHLFNVVTNVAGVPHAVLIRGIYPLLNAEIMFNRRGVKGRDSGTAFNGPGKVSKALGIGIAHNRVKLSGKTIWIEDRNLQFNPGKLLVTPRIGVDYAKEDALLPYRFYLSVSDVNNL